MCSLGHRIIAVGLLSALTLPAFSCNARLARVGHVDLVELANELLEAADLPAATTFRPSHVLTFGEGETPGVAYPSDLSFLDEDRILVVDNMGGRVIELAYSPSGVRAQVRYSNLEAPYRINVWQGKVYIQTNLGLYLYQGLQDREGRLQRVFYSTSDFEPADEGTYLATRHSEADENEPLIVLTDEQWRPIREMGRRNNDITLADLDNSVFLALASKKLICVYEYTTQVSMLRRSDGQELRRVAVRHPIFDQLVEETRPFRNPAPGTVFAPKLTAGAAVAGDKLYVLLHLPYIEIVEFNLEGKETARFRCQNLGVDLRNYGGFDAIKTTQGIRFAIAARQDAVETPLLMLFQVAHNGFQLTSLED